MATKVRTLRLPEDVIATIEGFPGESFTEKFVCAARLLGERRDALDRESAQLRAHLSDIEKLLRERDAIQRSLDEISWRLSGVAHDCKVLQDGVVQLSSDHLYKGS